jgi:hypothetical protein
VKKVALALMLLVGEARAEEKLGISGNDLLEFCQAGEPSLENPARVFCCGYILGLFFIDKFPCALRDETKRKSQNRLEPPRTLVDERKPAGHPCLV